jgi:hypothetical protein
LVNVSPSGEQSPPWINNYSTKKNQCTM